MTFALQPHRMGILHVHAAATAHELQDIDLVTQALEWLTETDWNVDMTTSYHAPKVAMLSTQIKKNKQLESFTQKLEPGIMQHSCPNWILVWMKTTSFTFD